MLKPVPGLPIADQPEAIVKRMVLWGEARGEPAMTKLAILWVIRNRMTQHATHWKDEILKDRQFSCFNHDDPNLPKLLIGYQLEPAAWAECGVAVDLFDWTKDPTGGASSYYNFTVSQPTWGRGNAQWKERLIIGDLVFGVAG